MGEQITSPLGEFKPREIEILGLMAAGLSNQEIGDALFVTKQTVRWYLKIIYSKLGTSRRTEAVALARKFGLIGDVPVDRAPSTGFELPNTTGPFVGREQDIEAMTDLLARPEVRLLTLLAAGGMGKSRLALEFGHRIEHRFKDGAAFVDLTAVQRPNDIAQAALTALGQTGQDQVTPQKQLINYCQTKELLLIFDNFEHVLPGAPLLAEILKSAPNITVLATTRERLNLRAESVYYLQPLSQSGGQLFYELAEMIHPHIEIDRASQPAVERVVNLVGGVPLAILLAVAWLDTLSPTEIADEIAANLDFLSGEMGDMPARQRSIRALLEPTWTRLSPEEQRAFMWASVFRGGFTREMFQQVTRGSVRVLQRLLHCSLIEQGHGRRYGLHPLMHQYASEKLVQHQMETAARKAHLEAFSAYADTLVDQLEHGHYLDSVQRLDLEQDNFRAALDWSLAGHDVDSGITLANRLQSHWTIRSQFRDVAHYFELALAYRPDMAILHLRLAFAYHRLGNPEGALNHNQEARRLAIESQAFDIVADSLRYSSFIGGTARSAQEAQGILDEAMRYAQMSGNPRVIANCHGAYGMMAFDYDTPLSDSLAHFQEALTYYEERGELLGISIFTYNMAVAHRMLGDYKQARTLCERSLDLKREIGDRAGEARRLSALANWDIDEEEFEQAARALAGARAICEELGEHRRLQSVVLQQGILAMIMGHHGQSEELLKQALELAQALNEHESTVHAYLGLLFLLTGQVKQSELHVNQSIHTLKAFVGDRWSSVIAYGNLMWAKGNVAACTPIAAIMQRELTRGEARDALGTRYFLRPLIHRVQQSVGQDAWRQALAQAADVDLEQLVQEIGERLQES